MSLVKENMLPFITHDEIAKMVKGLAKQIDAEYEGKVVQKVLSLVVV